MINRSSFICLSAVLALSFISFPMASSAEILSISSMTTHDPYDLIQGTAAPTAELAQVPWYPEYLEFEIGYGILSVGKATMRAQEMNLFNGTPSLHIVSEAQSNSFCDTFYKVRDINEAWMHASAFYSLGYLKKLREGNFFRNEWVLYDYLQKTYLSKITNNKGEVTWKTGALPGNVEDILSSLYFIRNKPLKVGDEFTLDVNTKENWPLVVKVLRTETVSVGAGKFNCVVVEPFIRKEGIFIQKGKNLQVWLTDDERHLPVKLSVEVFFGHVTASLVKASKTP